MKLAAHVTDHFGLSQLEGSHVGIYIPSRGLKPRLDLLFNQELFLDLSVLERVFVDKGLIILHEAIELLLSNPSKTIHYPLVNLLCLLVKQVFEVQIIDFVWYRELLMHLCDLELALCQRLVRVQLIFLKCNDLIPEREVLDLFCCKLFWSNRHRSLREPALFYDW